MALALIGTPPWQISGVEILADLDVTNAEGKTASVQQRYQWRFVDNQWFITARLQ